MCNMNYCTLSNFHYLYAVRGLPDFFFFFKLIDDTDIRKKRFVLWFSASWVKIIQICNKKNCIGFIDCFFIDFCLLKPQKRYFSNCLSESSNATKGCTSDKFSFKKMFIA